MITSYNEVFDKPKYQLNILGFVCQCCVLCCETGRPTLAVNLSCFLGQLNGTADLI